MPVKSEEDYFGTLSEPLVSDDVWKKFHWDLPEYTVLTDFFVDKKIKTEPSSPTHSSSSLLDFDCGSNSLSDYSSMLSPLSPSGLISPPSPSSSFIHPMSPSSGSMSPLDASRSCGFSMGLQTFLPSLKNLKDCISNHDCMWNGHCASDEHPADELRSNINSLIPQPPVVSTTPVAFNNIKQEPNIRSSGQQSLLKPAVRMANTMLQTPPMSDDDEEKNAKPTQLLQILNQAISECDEIDEDSDLCEYFDEDVDVLDSTDSHINQEKDNDDDEYAEEDDEEDEEEQIEIDEVSKKQEEEEMCIRMKFAAESDHSYHKGKNCSMNMDVYGLVTPSDSEEEEEEIDVVSVNPKNAYALPYNPSNKDCQQFQRKVVTAMRKREMSNGIKSIMPVRKSATTAALELPANKKRTESRGVKRSRQYKSSYTKKRTHHSSDSEPEPSEKRSLHNNMERQRRIDLRNAFEDLRHLVPEVSKKERAAKVVILREASQYCKFLTNSHNNYLTHLEELKRKQEWLRSRVSNLRRKLAIKR